MEIERINNGDRGLFRAVEKGVQMGFLSFIWMGDDKFVIDSTEVKPEFGGKGIGHKLVKSAVEYARSSNLKILPECPFAVKLMVKDDSMKDVLAEEFEQ